MVVPRLASAPHRPALKLNGSRPRKSTPAGDEKPPPTQLLEAAESKAENYGRFSAPRATRGNKSPRGVYGDGAIVGLEGSFRVAFEMGVWRRECALELDEKRLGKIRHLLKASWVPSPPGKHTSQNRIIYTFPRTAGKQKTGHPLV